MDRVCVRATSFFGRQPRAERLETHSGTALADRVDVYFGERERLHRAAPIRGRSRTLLTALGYAAVYNVRYLTGEGDVEIIRPGAFAPLIANVCDGALNVQAFIGHEHDGATGLLADTESGTLQLAEDFHGLYVVCKFDPSTAAGDNLRRGLHHGIRAQMSFAFSDECARVQRSPDWIDGRPVMVREVAAVHAINDVGFCHNPANPATFAILESSIQRDPHERQLPQAIGKARTRALLARSAWRRRQRVAMAA